MVLGFETLNLFALRVYTMRTHMTTARRTRDVEDYFNTILLLGFGFVRFGGGHRKRKQKKTNR